MTAPRKRLRVGRAVRSPRRNAKPHPLRSPYGWPSGEPRRTSAFTISAPPLTLQNLIAASTALGGVIYVLLSSLYARFYGPLSIDMSEVGLNKAEVLVRSAGGVAAIIFLTAVVGLAMLAARTTYYFLAVILARLLSLASACSGQLSKLTDSYKRLSGSSSALRALGRVYWIPGVSRVSDLRPGRAYFVSAFIGIAAVILPLAYISFLADVDDRSAVAAGGGSVRPVTLLGLPVLDVKSVPCEARWLGPVDVGPPELASRQLHCIGNNSSIYIFRLGRETVRVPNSLVVVVSRT